MMFATLDDLEGSVELLVFGRALAAHEEALALDSVVLVRGKVDHKDANSTCVILQEASQIRADRGGGRESARAGAHDPGRPAAGAPAARRDGAAGERDRRPQSS